MPIPLHSIFDTIVSNFLNDFQRREVNDNRKKRMISVSSIQRLRLITWVTDGSTLTCEFSIMTPLKFMISIKNKTDISVALNANMSSLCKFLLTLCGICGHRAMRDGQVPQRDAVSLYLDVVLYFRAKMRSKTNEKKNGVQGRFVPFPERLSNRHAAKLPIGGSARVK